MEVKRYFDETRDFAAAYKGKRVRALPLEDMNHELHNLKGVVIGISASGGGIMVKLDTLERPRVFLYDELEIIEPLPLPG